jgi:hypothetical protein
VVGIFLLSCQLPCGGEGRDEQAEPDHRFTVCVEVGGVGDAVAADVGAGGVLRVGPPVVALGVEVVKAAGAALASGGSDSDGLQGEVFVGGCEDSRAVCCRDHLVWAGR